MVVRGALAIVNPATGRTPADAIVAQLRAEAERRGVALHVALTQRPGHAVEIARDHPDDIETIIAVGGDGTVSDVVTGARNDPLTIAIIPAGSTNIIAKDLGIPRNIASAIRVALGDGEPVEIDVATTGNATILHMAGAGFDAAIMRDVSRLLKRRVGWLAYLPPAARHLRYPAFNATITVDGETIVTPARVVLLALGSAIIDPRLRVGDGINRADGKLDVVVFNPPSLLGALSCVGWLLLRRPARSRWQRQLRGRRVTLGADRPVPFEIDGDSYGTLPVDVVVSPRKVRVMTPRPTTGSTRDG